MDARRSDLISAARAHASETSARVVAFHRYLEHISNHIQEARKRAEGPHTGDGTSVALVRAGDDLRVHEEELLVAQEQLQLQQQAVLAGRAALEEALGYYRDLFLEGLDAVAVTTSSGVVKEANRSMARALGVDPRFFAGKPLIAFISRKACEAFRDLLGRARGSPHGAITAAALEFRPRRKAPLFDAEVLVQTVVGPSFAADASMVTELRWVIRLGARANARDQATLTKAKGVLASVAHDLRNPLSVLELSLGAITPRLGGDPRSLAIASTMRRAVQRMHHLVSDVLASTTLESGGLAIHVAPARIGDVVRDAVAFVEPLAESRGIPLTMALPSDEVIVPLDERRVGQVLINLLDNALKFSSRGTAIALEIITAPDRVRVEVRDQGPGLPSGGARPFDLFWQADPGKREGSGLGLAIAKHIIEKHGGHIGVASSQGAGATFWFELPRVAAPALADGEKGKTPSSIYPVARASEDDEEQGAD